ncbi:leucine-rich repeat domain-containing protein [Bifidobacterium sp. ESL0690]|uniref:leucine-rich repeat domain-containing protein n=1 Tax=Bifidobacterium sp. ESL0690 TaxID=2983214 RepID=UPI0023F61F54|nr:leucine-rich repeat domain-containing protein [Bifidobacterium sp. ESL0690]WEV46391.1 leucine-rich repeat domain-containing protein [Bifidobacterium sp. ESL0690]
MAGVAMVLPGTATAVEPESGEASQQTQSQSSSSQQGQAASPGKSKRGQKSTESSNSVKQGKSGLQPRGGGISPRSSCYVNVSTIAQCFPDTYLAAKVASAERVNVNSTFTQTMVNGTTSLNAAFSDIASLEGMQNFTNLRTLSLDHNQVTSLSPLAGLAHLTTLSLDYNQVTNFSPLAGLPNLTSLSVVDNNISDLNSSYIQYLTHLTGVNLDTNLFSDISPLAGLTQLTSLEMANVPVSDLSPLAGLTHLTAAGLYGDRITDLSPLAGWANLQVLNLQNYAGWANHNSIVDVSPLRGLTSLTDLRLGGNKITDFSPLNNLHLNYLEASGQVATEAAYDDGSHVTMSTVKNIDGTFITASNISPSGGTYDSTSRVVSWPSGTTNPKFDFTGTLPNGVTGSAPAGTVTGDPVSHVTGHPTVRFDSQGGDSIPDQKVPWGGTAYAPTNPAKTGCTFGAWHTGSATGPVYGFDIVYTTASTVTLYASWVPAHYDVRFDTSGGSWDGTAQGPVSTEYDATISEPANLAHLKAPTHKQRSGWEYRKTDSMDGWATFTFGTTHMPGWPITVRPVWEGIPHHMTYDKNGGSWSDMPASPVRVGEDDTVSQPSLTDFAPPANKHQDTLTSGWEYRKTDSTENWAEFKFGVTHVPAYDITVRPKWVTDQYNVSYQKGEATSWGSKPTAEDHDYGSTLASAPPIADLASPANKHHAAWEYSKDNGATWGPFVFGGPGSGTAIPAHDIIIRPTFAWDQYGVSYELGDATSWAGKPGATNHDYGSTLSEPLTSDLAAPANKHHDAWEYSKDNGATWGPFEFGSTGTHMPAHAIIIRPTFTMDTYSVSYQLGEATSWTGKPGAADHAYNSTLTEPGISGLNAPANKHHDAWEYSQDNGATWNPFEFGSTGTHMPAHAIVIRPTFAWDQYSVSYENGDATSWTGKPGAVNHDYGSTLTEPGISGLMAPANKHHDAWQYSKDGGATWDSFEFGSTGTHMPAHAIVIRPTFAWDQYSVSYQLGEATSWTGMLGPVDHDFGSTLTEPSISGLTAPANKHHDAWQYSKDGGATWNTFEYGSTGTHMPAHAIVIRPTFAWDQYNVSYQNGEATSWTGKPAAVDHDYGSTLSEPGITGLTAPANKHHDAWQYSQDGGATWNPFEFGSTGTHVPAHAIVIRPTFAWDQYSVSYQLGEATSWAGMLGTVDHDYGSTLTEPNISGLTAPVNKHHNAWEYSKDNGATWDPFEFGPTGTHIPAHAIIIRPTFSSDQYSVSYQLGEATSWTGKPGAVNHDYGSTLSEPGISGLNAPTNKHHDSWQYSQDNGATWNTFTFGSTGTHVPAHSIIIRPTFAWDQYSVTYQLNGATSWAGKPGAVDHDFGSTLSTPSISDLMAPANKHHDAWQYSKDNGATWDTFTYGPTGTHMPAHAIIIRPTFAWDQYSVSYQLGEATSWAGMLGPVDHDYGSTLSEPSTSDLAAPANKHHDAWEYSKDNGATWNPFEFGSTGTHIPAHAIIIRPTFAWDQYGVTYQLGEATSWAGKPGAVNHDYGSTLSEPGTSDLTSPSNKHHDAWQYSQDNGVTWNTFEYGSTGTHMPAHAIVIRPTFAWDQYSVSYQLGEAISWAGMLGPVNHDFGSTLTEPNISDLTAPMNKHHNAWEYSKDNGATWDPFEFGPTGTHIPAHAIIIRPTFSSDQYSVSYQLGEATSWTGKPSATDHAYNSTLTEPGTSDLNAPTHKHHDAWEYSQDNGVTWNSFEYGSTGTHVPAHSIIIRPTFAWDQYGVSYQNGEATSWTGKPGAVDHDYGSTLATEPSTSGLNAPAHKHHAAWQYSKDNGVTWNAFKYGAPGTGTAIPAHDIIIRPTFAWDQYSVSYELGEAASWAGMPGSVNHDYGSTLASEPGTSDLTAPANKHHKAWEYSKDNGASWSAFKYGAPGTGTAIPAHDVIIRPTFAWDQYSVSYRLGEATSWAGKPVTDRHDYGSTLATAPLTSDLTAPANKHHAAWEYSKDNGSTWSPFTYGGPGTGTAIPAHDVIIRPTFAWDQYSVSYRLGEATSWAGKPVTDRHDYGSTLATAPLTSDLTAPANKHHAAWEYSKDNGSTWSPFTYGGPGTGTTVPAHDVIIRPTFAWDQYSVSYQLGEATSWAGMLGPVDHDFGSTLATPSVSDLTAPANKHHDAWQYSKDGGVTWNVFEFGSTGTHMPAHDVIIRPTFAWDQYGVSYQNGEATSWTGRPGSTNHDYGSTLVTAPVTSGLTAPAHKHHVAWQYSKDSGVTWNSFTYGGPGTGTAIPAHAIIIRPTFAWDTYSVSYQLGEATSWTGMLGPVDHDYGSTLAAAPNTTGLTAPVNKHHAAWEYSKDNGATWSAFKYGAPGTGTAIPAHDIIVRPTFAWDQYGVSYQNGEATSWTDRPGSTNHDYGSTLVTAPVTSGLTAPAHKHHAAWEFSQDNGVTWNTFTYGGPGTGTAIPAHAIIVRPTFAWDQYRVGYAAGDGASWASMPGADLHDYGSTIATAPGTVDLTNPAHKHQEGWEFKAASGGWQDFAFGSTTIPASNITIRPKWVIDQFNVTFDADGGAWPTMPGVSAHNYGSTIATAPAGGFSKTGFLPRGWQYSTNGMDWNAFTFANEDGTATAIPAHDITIRPVWKTQLTITFDVEGGDPIAPRMLADGDPIGELPTPVRSGYRFDGWYVQSMLRSLVPYDPTAIVTGNMTVMAKWTKLQVTEPPSQGWLETPEGHHWLETPEGQHWLESSKGHAWVSTPEGHAWLQTPEGQHWLSSQDGHAWVSSPEGHAWLQTPQGHQWLETPQGHAWLQTHEGSAWLGTNGGHAWLQTPQGHQWLQTPEGHAWLQTPEGSAWLGTNGGHAWLATAEGQHWLSTPAGAAWLATSNGHVWLATSAGWAWLKTPAGQAWLKTLAGQAWLATPEGRKWLASQSKPKAVPATGSAVAVPMGLMVSALIMALGLQLIRRRRRDE